MSKILTEILKNITKNQKTRPIANLVLIKNHLKKEKVKKKRAKQRRKQVSLKGIRDKSDHDKFSLVQQDPTIKS